MSLILAETKEKSYEQPPEGTYPAVCYSIVDIGTQPNTFDGETTYKHQIIVSWQLAGDERTSGGEPFTVRKWYTASFHPKSRLRIDLESIRGRRFTPEELAGFDLQRVVGSNCMIGIVHDMDKMGKPKAKISSLMKLPKGMAVPELELEKEFFDLGRYDHGAFERLPAWLQTKISDSPEFQQASNKPKRNVTDDGGIGDMEDDVPQF